MGRYRCKVVSMKKAALFSGQGSQYVGMGKDLFEKYPVYRELVEKADDILKRKLSDIMFDGPELELTSTENAQPALLLMDYAIFEIMKDRGKAAFDFTAGHSLGEYAALAAAGAIAIEDALEIVSERGRLMAKAGKIEPGTMAAIIGLDLEKVQEICDENDADMANFNSPQQLVISGRVANVHTVMEACKAAGAKRAIQLNVSGAFHSRLMKKSGEQLAGVIREKSFTRPSIPVVMNVPGESVDDPEKIKQYLIEQVSSPVKWLHGMEYMINQDVGLCVECGPKNVLAGLTRRISRDVTTYTTDTADGLEKTMEAL